MPQRSFFPAALLISLCTLLPWVPSPAGAGVDRWTPVGPEGGRITVLAPDPTHPRVLYAGTDGGIFMSSTRGLSWRRRSAGLTDPRITALAVHPGSPTLLWAGTASGRAFKSTDAALSWSEAGDLPAATLFVIATDPADPEIAYAGTEAGLLKTVDGGASWQPKSQGLPDDAGIMDLAVVSSAPGTLYALVGSRAGRWVFRSVDGGESWSPRSQGLPWAVDLVLDPAAPATLYVAASGLEAVFKTTDGGASWFPANAERIGMEVEVLAIAPSRPSVLYAGGLTGVVRSDDGGATWTSPSFEAPPLEVTVLAVSPRRPHTVYAGTLGGIFRATDGATTWDPANAGLTATNVPALETVAGAPTTLLATTFEQFPPTAPLTLGYSRHNALYRSRDGGRSWSQAEQGFPAAWEERRFHPLTAIPGSPGSLYAGALGTLARSHDAGGHWTVAGAVYCGLFQSFVVDPSLPDSLYAGASLFPATFCAHSPPECLTYHSLDGGDTFQCTDFWTLAVDPGDSNVLYGLREDSPGRLEKSTDAGASWGPADAGLASTPVALVIDPARPSTLYAGTELGLYKSSNGAAFWGSAGDGLPAGLVSPLLLGAEPGRLYAAVAGGGIFTSDDGAGTWEPLDAGLPEGLSVTDLALDPEHPWILYAATRGGGVYRYTRRTPVPSTAGAETLCLGDGRFQVRVHWRTRRGREGAGRAVPATGDTGFFWFFDPDNYELMIKVLDGTGLNGHYWVFYGALSNVQYSIEVLDSATGEVRTYFNRQDEIASRGDTQAFEQERTSADGLAAAGVTSLGLDARSREPERRQGGCTTTSTALCLQGNRFRVEVAWEDFGGHGGTGTTVPLTADSGAFWFFEPSNYELVVKILDGRSFNGHFWVFYGSLSNVRYTLTVTDIESGLRRTYENPAGTFASVADTETF